MRTHKHGRAVLAALALAAGVLSMSGTPAFGFLAHPYLSQITQAPEGSPLIAPWGLAFDATGNLFAFDAERGQVDMFNAANAFQGAIGAGTLPKFYERSVAVDRATGDVYVAGGEDIVRVFKPAGAGKYTLLSTWSRLGNGYDSVAIDNSTSASDPHAGDVYVLAGPSTIDVFKPKPPGPEEAQEGEFVAALTTAGLELVYEGGGAPVDASTGALYVPDLGNHAVDEFNGEGTFTQAFKGSGESFAPVAVAVEESTHDVYAVDRASGLVDEFDSTGKQIGGVAQSGVAQIGGAAQPLATPRGVAVNSSGDVYISDSGSKPPAIDIFGPAVLLPDVTTGSAEPIKGSATVEGLVNPDGKAVTICEFEYGTTIEYGHTAACSPAPGSGSSPVAVTAKLPSLEGETTYHYRLAASNANGTHDGSDSTFTTPATVNMATEPATEVQGTSATLNGVLLPLGLDTHDWFEYGLTSKYGSKTPREDAGKEKEEEELKSAAVPVTSLEPNSTYHFRFVAENTFGVAYGADKTFTTKALAPAIGQPLPVSAITRVTATVSATIDPEKSPTTYRIDYGETSSYGQHSPVFQAGEGLGAVPVHVGLLGLAPARTYHYAVVASNQAGTVPGPDQTFTTAAPTPPTATTGGASNVALTTATVSGTIDPEGLETSYELDFGTDTTYGTSVYGEAGAGTAGVNIEVALKYLAPGTTYHYRLVAINSDGKTYGSDATLTTPAYSAPIVVPFTLPLLQTPAIAFPTEPGTPVVKKTNKGKHGKHHRKGAKRTKRKKKK